jgi:hypothetical protein
LSFVAALAGLGTAIYGKAHGNSPFFYGGTATLALSAVSTCYFTNKLIAKFTEIKDFYKKD